MKEKMLTSNGQMKEGYMVGRMVKWTIERGVHCHGNILMGQIVTRQMMEGRIGLPPNKVSHHTLL